MPLIPALRTLSQVELCEAKASLVYIMSSRTDRVRHCFEKYQNQNNNTIIIIIDNQHLKFSKKHKHRFRRLGAQNKP